MQILNALDEKPQPLEYCLYARKSSESDERQAMSIDSQVKEMRELALKENLYIKEIREESCSAKVSNSRPVFNRILSDIRSGIFNGILAWAPDRLSRNAGDLGSLIDLMDQGKLAQIKTYSQMFSNNPNEKFLLMILCSQAKLENDNRGLNVKRGIRAKCEMGWRPCMPPLGYYNRAFNGIKDIVIDPDRGPVVTEMFERVANLGHSGRTVKRWLDGIGFSNRAGKKVTLSQIYIMLKNTFYYGEFEYPVGSGRWYGGSHQPLVSKDMFDRVQKQLIVPRKSKWGSKGFAFKHLIKCASCRANIVGEEKLKKLKDGSIKRHVYYHCSKSKEYSCQEPYIREEELIKQLITFIDNLGMDEITISEKIEGSLQKYQKIVKEVLGQLNISSMKSVIDIKSYAKYILKEGSNRERAEFIKSLRIPLYLHDRVICGTQLNKELI